MDLVRMKKAIVNDYAEHPERGDTTFERLFEVLHNVLGDKGIKLTQDIGYGLEVKEPRSHIREEQADGIITMITNDVPDPADIQSITEQLEFSEISTEEAVEIHRMFKIPVSHLEEDMVPVRGSGSWVMDTKGRWFLDMDSNYSATNLGMNNDAIAKGLMNQASLLISMKEDRVQIARTRFLKEIHQMMPEGLTQFYWQNSGGEAVDKSIKIAKAHTGTKDVVAFKGGFHGRTHGAVSVTFNEKYRKPFLLDDEDWVHFAEFNDMDSVKKTFEESEARILIMEIVQGEEAGNKPADDDFIEQLWEYCRENDIIIIDDEVQAGFGRTAVKDGDWFACDSYGVVPDIMVIGKSFGGGYPVTAVVTRKGISGSMEAGYDGSTFGGNPMAMTSALIATREMRELDIISNVLERSKQFFGALNSLKEKHPVIGEVRGRGLMISFSLGSADNVKRAQEMLLEEGVKCSLSTGKYFRILPPTIISGSEVDTFIEKLDKVVGKL